MKKTFKKKKKKKKTRICLKHEGLRKASETQPVICLAATQYHICIEDGFIVFRHQIHRYKRLRRYIKKAPKMIHSQLENHTSILNSKSIEIGLILGQNDPRKGHHVAGPGAICKPQTDLSPKMSHLCSANPRYQADSNVWAL